MAALLSEDWSSMACGSTYASGMGIRAEEESKVGEEEVIPTIGANSVDPYLRALTSKTVVSSQLAYALPYPSYPFETQPLLIRY